MCPPRMRKADPPMWQHWLGTPSFPSSFTRREARPAEVRPGLLEGSLALEGDSGAPGPRMLSLSSKSHQSDQSHRFPRPRVKTAGVEMVCLESLPLYKNQKWRKGTFHCQALWSISQQMGERFWGQLVLPLDFCLLLQEVEMGGWGRWGGT